MINLKTQAEYLDALDEQLKYLPIKERREILVHYRDKINIAIDYGETEEKVVSKLTSPEDIAKDIYRAHGINYIDIRKKRLRIKEILISIISAVVMLGCLLLLVVAGAYLGFYLYRMALLLVKVFTFKSITDAIISFILVLSYLGVMLVACIYVIDLFIIVETNLLAKVVKAIPNKKKDHYGFTEFTITGWLNKITKRKKLLLGIMAVSAGILLVTGISSYVTKGYIYRTIQDLPSQEINLEIKETFSQIKINTNQGNIVIMENSDVDKPTIKYQYELDNQMEAKVIDGTLTFDMNKNYSYDIFRILKEPTTRIYIYVPLGYELTQIDAKLEYGNISLQNLTRVDNVKIDVYSGQVSLFKNRISNLTLSVFTGTTKSNLNTILEKAEVNYQTGTYLMEQDNIKDMKIVNQSTKITFVSSIINDLNINNQSGTIYLENVTGNNLKFMSTTSISEMYDMNYETAEVNITSTCSLKIIRSRFTNTLKTISSSSAYLTLQYVKSPLINIDDNNGQIIIENLNNDYSQVELNKLDSAYLEKGQTYNDYELTSQELTMIGKSSQFSLKGATLTKFTMNLANGPTALSNITCFETELVLRDVQGEVESYRGTNFLINVRSSDVLKPSNVDIDNQNILLVIYDKDGASTLVLTNNTPETVQEAPK